LAAWAPVDVFRGPPLYDVLRFPPYALEREPHGERLLVLGDSFTQAFWRPMLLHTGAARVGWMYFAECAFDFTDVERFQPTHVIVASTERLVVCRSDRWPRGLPRDPAMAAR
jgi:hypothetical protein